nr:unnamed protein product [Digitaria exilis]
MPSGKLFTWGDADRGKLGHADKKMKLVPTCVDSLADYDFVEVSCGTALTVVLSITGVVFTIGSSMHGRLGNPQADGKSVCVVEGLLKCEFVRHISSGSSHVAVLTTDGKVFTWGNGKEGQLGSCSSNKVAKAALAPDKSRRYRVTLLAEQYQQKNLQVQLYKQKLDETWLIVRDEAAKCKAAKDIIKVLTDQCKAMSEKLLVGYQSENPTITYDINQGQPLTADLQHCPREKLATGKFSQVNTTKNHQTSSQGDEKYAPPSNSDMLVDGPCNHQNGSQTFDVNGCITDVDAPVSLVMSNGVIEQIERGVYVTFDVSSSGEKDIRRVRFSRKHFGEKEAQQWWEENKSKVYANYGTEQMQNQLAVPMKTVQLKE